MEPPVLHAQPPSKSSLLRRTMLSFLKLLGILFGSLVAFMVIALSWEGCKAKRQASLDQKTLEMAITDGGIDQVKIVSEDGTENVLTREGVRTAKALFAATNRIPWSAPMFLKLYFAGYVRLHNTEKSQTWIISYIPDYDAATYGEYYFRLKGTNDLRDLFQSPGSNPTNAAFAR